MFLADDLVLGPSPCMVQMVKKYEKYGGNVIAVMEVPAEQTNRYGIIDVQSRQDDIIVAKGVVEKPDWQEAPSRLAFIGRYILQPEIFCHLDKAVKSRKETKGEIQLTDSINAMVGDVPVYGFRFEGTRYDCGSKSGFLEANIGYALSRPDLREDMLRILEMYNGIDRVKAAYGT